MNNQLTFKKWLDIQDKCLSEWENLYANERVNTINEYEYMVKKCPDCDSSHLKDKEGLLLMIEENLKNIHQKVRVLKQYYFSGKPHKEGKNEPKQ